MAKKTPKRARVTWPEVLRVLGNDETRSLALSSFKASSFDADLFKSRIEARELVANGLTKAEDWLEVTYHRRRLRQEERLAIKEVRQRLEIELWP